MWFETVSQNTRDHVKGLVSHKYCSFKAIPSPATRFDVNGLVRGVGRAVGASVAVASDPFQWKVFWVHWQTHFWCAVLHIHLCGLGRNAERRKRVDGVARLIKCPRYMREVCVWVTRGGEERIQDGCDLKGEKSEIWWGRTGDTREGGAKRKGRRQQIQIFLYAATWGQCCHKKHLQWCNSPTVGCTDQLAKCYVVEIIYFYLLTRYHRPLFQGRPGPDKYINTCIHVVKYDLMWVGLSNLWRCSAGRSNDI